MTARRILRAVLRPFKRLIRRIFWRHQWEYRATPYPTRKCKVCGQCQAVATGASWYTLLKGAKARHYTGAPQ